MNRIVALALLTAGGCIALAAQSISAFDVASVRPSEPGKKFDCRTLPGGRFICHNMPVQNLVLTAFADKPLTPIGRVPRLKGAPEWITDEYDIDAIAEGAGEMSSAQLAGPLFALLHERFGLVAHVETVQEAGYLLEQQQSGAKLKPSAPDAVYSVKRTAEGVVYTAGTVQILAALAGNRSDVNAPVVDNTGLEGKYDFTYRYDFAAAATPDAAKPPAADAENSTRDSLAVLGLRLVPETVTLSLIVIDQIHRPSEN